MSTICKLDPTIRHRRAMRRNLLRNPPRDAHPAIMAELWLIAKSSRLTGETKQSLFERGARQIGE